MSAEAAGKAKYFSKADTDASGKRQRLLKGVEGSTVVVSPGTFVPSDHFYERTLNAVPHPLVSYFFNMTKEQIAARYSHLHPEVDEDALKQVLNYEPQLLPWAGTDLFNVTNAEGVRRMCVVETNSSPSGQKSMPPLNDSIEHGAYATHMQTAFKTAEAGSSERVPGGRLAVLFDKNYMEASGYAKTMADVFDEEVFLVEYHYNDDEPAVKFEDSVMYVLSPEGEWVAIRACMRYVTQKPWCALPVTPIKTVIMNSVAACLAGGRNKLVASKAYKLLSAQLSDSGLRILAPYTVNDVQLASVPLYVASLGGVAVVKSPYGNAGAGVWCITSPRELAEFMEDAKSLPYDVFIVQGLVGGANWSSHTPGAGRLYHVGMMPTKKGKTFVADLRFMVGNVPGRGLAPLAMYARRAREPLPRAIDDGLDSWACLGTNLSTSLSSTDSSRLILCDRRQFAQLGIGLDDLIAGFVQSVMAVMAIDVMALRVTGAKESTDSSMETPAAELEELRKSDDERGFDVDLFYSLCADAPLLEEICVGIERVDPEFAADIRARYNLETIVDHDPMTSATPTAPDATE
ncbi:uncharacterized protein AMSG_10929 [Thecamonas trahens ATCC 50062]|uniref:Uncharacterized protein n=1 Tax=Thecamonas trahens ATCC 50062 TaxID=461836 RepID=A0A0L0DUU9_THETB|nr:hypothetical protein AMSG_10929 [Thecamonas trahens ATCC 50062]KNC55288.1 hypothetical protein AMSG_10929 [Thecamonas trahens ATCC 50062]|eukprot:XP_013753109.1 hypothetical protein AMSG_10929 [Thecamonas trahens ATCC 50062]